MEIKLNSNIYPVEAILNACYVFIDRVYISLDTDSKTENIKVSFKGKNRPSEKKLQTLKGEFMNELLHSALRYKVSKNNKKIREYIVGRALYSALPTHDFDLSTPSEKLDYQEDPLGISIPWEEKYSKKKKNNARAKV